MNNKNPIYVTRPNLPQLEKLQPYMEEIWKNKILINTGPYHKKFETELAKYLNVDNINLFANATIALVVGLQALRITGKVITTPFTFVATTHVLNWNDIILFFAILMKRTSILSPKEKGK